MQIHISPLDGRHAGNRMFTHRAEILGPWDQRRHNFVEMRQWCWESYGPGVERDLSHCLPDTKWAWHVGENPSSYYIYLKAEQLTHFSLKWK